MVTFPSVQCHIQWGFVSRVRCDKGRRQDSSKGGGSCPPTTVGTCLVHTSSGRQSEQTNVVRIAVEFDDRLHVSVIMMHDSDVLMSTRV